MRTILLNSKPYKILGEITQRAINPWMAKISSGSREYDDLSSQASPKEYHDFRNGLGLQSELPAESNRLWWAEGIDFSTARSAVLGPLVNKAGAFGVAPVKIIDFENATYAFGASIIKKWNTPNWDTKFPGTEICDCDDVWTSDQGANVVCSADTSDKKEGTGSAKFAIADAATTGDCAHKSITAMDLTGHTVVSFWAKSSVALNAGDYDIHFLAGGVSKAGGNIPACVAGVWTECEVVTSDLSTSSAIDALYLQCHVDKGAHDLWIDIIRLDAFPPTDSFIDAIVATDATDSYLVVSTATKAIYTTDGTAWATLTGCKGYLAFYNTKLHGIATTGKTLYSSAADNIDGTWTSFNMSGDFGTVYDLFEGKLLSDGTPTLYFCGTEGLFNIDIVSVTEGHAHKQEVEYPPLTYSGHKGIYWNANVWVATGYGILKVGPSMATFVGPDLDDGLPSGYQGYIYNMVTVNNWLVFCVNGGTTDRSSILKRNSSLGGNLQVYTTSEVNKPIACLHHSPSSLYTNGRLWFGEGTDIKYMMFPDITSNVKQIATYEYAQYAEGGTLPILRKLAAISKVALGLAAITKSCNDNDYISIYYGLNGASAGTTALGTFKTSPKPAILTFGSGLGIEFYTIQFLILLYRGTSGTTPERNSPELESLLFYYLPRLVVINAWTFIIEATDEDAEARIVEFEAFRDTKTLLTFNPTGDTAKTAFNFYVALTTMPMRFWVEEQGTRQTKGIQITVEQVFSG